MNTPAVYDHQVTGPIGNLQAALEAHASPGSRDWWTGYMKGVIPFRGVGIPAIREVVAGWREAEGLDAAPVAQQFHIATSLIRLPAAEDKLAGIIYLQQYLVGEYPWRQAVPHYARLFDEQAIFDWGTCDWFCVRVLGPTIQHGGLHCARTIAAWHTAANLWRARASAVAFVYLVKDRRYHPLLERACGTLIHREERFAKTAVGWVMRELSKHDAPLVKRFVRDHRQAFSTESLRNATKYFRSRA
jgi:3-methyladenine DNA glycosylase AlkD